MIRDLKNKTFGNFLPLSGTTAALKMAKRFCDYPVQYPHAVISRPGDGKTHFLSAIINELELNSAPKLKISHLSVGVDFRAPYSLPQDVDVLILDDLSGSVGNELALTAIGSTIKRITQAGGRVFAAFASTNESDDWIVPFFFPLYPLWKTTRIQPAPFAERLLVASTKAREFRIDIGEQEIRKIAEFSKTVRDIESQLIRLDTCRRLGENFKAEEMI